MKSPMVMAASCIEDTNFYSELKVMKSNAGYYIGTEYHNPNEQYPFYSARFKRF